MSSHFNDLLNEFRIADAEEVKWEEADLDEAEYFFKKAKKAWRGGHYCDAEGDLTRCLQRCRWVLSGLGPADRNTGPGGDSTDAPHALPEAARLGIDPYLEAWAWKRSSGAITQLADCLLGRADVGRGVESLVGSPELASMADTLGRGALKAAQAGAALGSVASVADHLRPLAYNALVAYGYLRIAWGEPFSEEVLADVERHYARLEKLDTNGADRKDLATSDPSSPDFEYGWWLVWRELQAWQAGKPAANLASAPAPAEERLSSPPHAPSTGPEAPSPSRKRGR